MRLYDTLRGEVRALKPLRPGHFDLYVCGLTTYDLCHVGHARTFLTFDLLVRHLRSSGLKVRHVRNITDVDDRIIERALEQGVPAAELTERMIGLMHRDFAGLELTPPDFEPRATGSIDLMLTMIDKLQADGLAYRTAAGNLWFRVGAFPAYGRLSGRSGTDDTLSRQSAQEAGDKEDPRDFALWKAASADDRATGSVWDSPWGPGRPGWHIECSAMSTGLLGDEFDLHGGGLDLLFPHHENELAQSRGAGCAFARHWMHVAPLQMGREKMSKSLGNVLRIDRALQRWGAEVLRHALMSAHYRSPLEFQDERAEESRAVLDRWYGALEAVGDRAAGGEAPKTSFAADFEAALDEDLNVPAALRVLSGLARQVHKESARPATARALAAELVGLAGRLGLLKSAPDQWFRRSGSLSEAEIRSLIDDRERARRAKDYAEADRIRRQLAEQQIELLDGPQGTSWRFRADD